MSDHKSSLVSRLVRLLAFETKATITQIINIRVSLMVATGNKSDRDAASILAL